MLHDFGNGTFQDITQLVNGVDFHIHIVAKPVNLTPAHVVTGIQAVLRNVFCCHCLPEFVILYHICAPVVERFFLLFLHYAISMEKDVVPLNGG